MDAQRSPVPQRNRSGQHGTSSFGKSFLLPGCPPSFPAVINIRHQINPSPAHEHVQPVRGRRHPPTC